MTRELCPAALLQRQPALAVLLKVGHRKTPGSNGLDTKLPCSSLKALEHGDGWPGCVPVCCRYLAAPFPQVWPLLSQSPGTCQQPVSVSVSLSLALPVSLSLPMPFLFCLGSPFCAFAISHRRVLVPARFVEERDLCGLGRWGRGWMNGASVRHRGLGFQLGEGVCAGAALERPWFTKQINHCALQAGVIRYSKGSGDDLPPDGNLPYILEGGLTNGSWDRAEQRWFSQSRFVFQPLLAHACQAQGVPLPRGPGMKVATACTRGRGLGATTLALPSHTMGWGCCGSAPLWDTFPGAHRQQERGRGHRAAPRPPTCIRLGVEA